MINRNEINLFTDHTMYQYPMRQIRWKVYRLKNWFYELKKRKLFILKMKRADRKIDMLKVRLRDKRMNSRKYFHNLQAQLRFKLDEKPSPHNNFHDIMIAPIMRNNDNFQFPIHTYRFVKDGKQCIKWITWCDSDAMLVMLNL